MSHELPAGNDCQKIEARVACPCSNQSWFRGRHEGVNRSVIAYLRADTNERIDEQRQKILLFCQAEGYNLISEHVEMTDAPSLEWQHALADLNKADGLIVSDLERLVWHRYSPARDLRPLLHNFLCQGGKHLIAVAEGLNTATPAGQQVAMEYITQLKDAKEGNLWSLPHG